MPEAHGHSLWFTPRANAAARFAQIIHDLSQSYGTPYFPPHVTLLPRVSQARATVVELARHLAHKCRPFDIELGELATTKAYFQSLFIKAHRSKVLVQIHQLALRLFGSSQTDYMPHLSLVYGDLEEIEKKAIIAKVDHDFPVRFTAESIDIYLTEGRPEEWQLIETVPLMKAFITSRQARIGGGCGEWK
jgi:2'-5' RNA ligase